MHEVYPFIAHKLGLGIWDDSPFFGGTLRFEHTDRCNKYSVHSVSLRLVSFDLIYVTEESLVPPSQYKGYGQFKHLQDVARRLGEKLFKVCSRRPKNVSLKLTENMEQVVDEPSSMGEAWHVQREEFSLSNSPLPITSDSPASPDTVLTELQGTTGSLTPSLAQLPVEHIFFNGSGTNPSSTTEEQNSWTSSSLPLSVQIEEEQRNTPQWNLGTSTNGSSHTLDIYNTETRQQMFKEIKDSLNLMQELDNFQ